MKKLIVVSILIFVIMISMCTGCGRIETGELIAISNGTNTSGSFFLGCGNIKEQPVYYYYCKNLDGSFSLKYAFCKNSFIYEDLIDGQEPYYTHNSLCDEDRGYNFHVPKNSIIKTYELNIKNIK